MAISLSALFLFFFLSFNLVSALPQDGGISINFNYDKINYSTKNVNNSQFLQGYTPLTLPISTLTQSSLNNKLNIDGSNAANPFAIDTNTLYVDGTNNRVGIGTNDPSTTLDVKGTLRIYQVGIAANLGKGTNTDTYIELAGRTRVGHDSPYGAYLQSGTNGVSLSGSSSTFGAAPDLRIDTAGRVGIGTTTPSSKLDVVGQIGTSGGSNTAPAYSFIGDTDTGFYQIASDRLGMSAGGQFVGEFQYGTNIRRATYYGQDFGVTPSVNDDIFRLQVAGGTVIGSHLIDETNGAYYIEAWKSGTGYNIPLILNNFGGNVGIGTTTPQNKLTVIGDGNFTGDLVVQGNINVTGCVRYNGGVLGTCI